LKCSDCCECEVALNAIPHIVPTVHTPPAPESGAEVEIETEAAPTPSLSEAPEPDPIPSAEQ
jgi:hypothetical protein